jgi:hypothetical protein
VKNQFKVQNIGEFLMLKVNFEGTPVAVVPVQPFNANSPVYWEAGAFGMLDSNGNGVVSDGASGAYGILADRRSNVVGISNATFVPSNVGSYGDESLFNQPGHGNSLYGTVTSTGNQTMNAIIPLNTIPTTTLLKDETSANPNLGSRYITLYTRGGTFDTDQFDATQTYVSGQSLYIMQDGTGRVTNQKPASNSILVGITKSAVSGNGLLGFKLVLI